MSSFIQSQTFWITFEGKWRQTERLHQTIEAPIGVTLAANWSHSQEKTKFVLSAGWGLFKNSKVYLTQQLTSKNQTRDQASLKPSQTFSDDQKHNKTIQTTETNKT